MIEGVLKLHRFYSEQDAERAAAAKADRAGKTRRKAAGSRKVKKMIEL